MSTSTPKLQQHPIELFGINFIVSYYREPPQAGRPVLAVASVQTAGADYRPTGPNLLPLLAVATVPRACKCCTPPRLSGFTPVLELIVEEMPDGND